MRHLDTSIAYKDETWGGGRLSFYDNYDNDGHDDSDPMSTLNFLGVVLLAAIGLPPILIAILWKHYCSSLENENIASDGNTVTVNDNEDENGSLKDIEMGSDSSSCLTMNEQGDGSATSVSENRIPSSIEVDNRK